MNKRHKNCFVYKELFVNIFKRSWKLNTKQEFKSKFVKVNM